MVKMKPHPTLGIMVRSDGLVFVPATKHTKEHWTYGSKSKRGYLRVRILGKEYLVHRLIAETFIPNPNGLPQVDHIKFKERTNNDVSNLRWVTAQENTLNRRNTVENGHRSIDFATTREYNYDRWKRCMAKKLKESK